MAYLGVGSYPVPVSETNAYGHVVYENQEPLVTLNVERVQLAIRRSILTQKGIAATVSCPREVLQRAALTFTCSAQENGAQRQFQVTQVDGNGRVQYIERS